MSESFGTITLTTNSDVWRDFKKITYKYIKNINYNRKPDDYILHNYFNMYDRTIDEKGKNEYTFKLPFPFVGGNNITKDYKIGMIKYIENNLKDYGDIFYQDIYKNGAVAYDTGNEMIEYINNN